MNRLFLLIVSLLFAFYGTSQRVRISEDTASVNNVNVMLWKKQRGGTEAHIRSLSAETTEIIVRYRDHADPAFVTDENPGGSVHWFEVHFVTFDILCEVSSQTHKDLLKLFTDHQLYVDGLLKEQNVRRFASKFGTTYSSRYKGTVPVVN